MSSGISGVLPSVLKARPALQDGQWGDHFSWEDAFSMWNRDDDATTTQARHCQGHQSRRVGVDIREWVKSFAERMVPLV